MRTGSRLWGTTLALLALAAMTPAPATADPTKSADRAMEKVYGFLQGYPGDCPPAEAPQDPFVCHEVVLSAWWIGTDGSGTIPKTRNGWVLSAVRHTLSFPGGGADPTESDVVDGFSTDPVVTFDQQHLSSAHLVDQVHMSDGSTLDVDATWTATSDRLLYGNDGPAISEGGRVHHLRGDCFNEVNQAHQKYRLAHVHALLDGVPSDDLSIFAFLAFNHFTVLDVRPASCA